MRSLEYWDQRWSAAPLTAKHRFEASWPDDMARWLELRFIAKQLKRLYGFPDGSQTKPLAKILEIGCGPFTLSEDVEIKALLDACEYTGIDGSQWAIKEAQERSGHTFICADLAGRVEPDGQHYWPLTPADCIISRRTLQNLTPEERMPLWTLILSYPHGILVECSDAGLNSLNSIRALNNLPVLHPPEFNDYLGPIEESHLLQKATPVNFAGIYYLLTRGILNLKEFNTQYHYRAASLSHDCPTPANIAPLRGYYW